MKFDQAVLNLQNVISLLLLSVSLYWIVCRCREYLSDLSRIPSAHPLARWTSLWMSWIRWQGLEFEVARVGFEKHGPMIRVGPKDIFLASIDDVTENVYGIGSANMDRPPFQDVHMLFGLCRIVSLRHANLLTLVVVLEQCLPHGRLSHIAYADKPSPAITPRLSLPTLRMCRK